MTDYIEQMMKTAGVKAEKRFKKCNKDAKYTGLCPKYPCISCENSIFIDKYPDFSAEKQLELIKLIGKTICQHCYTLEIETDEVEKFYILSLISQRTKMREFNVFGVDFSQVLAQLAIKLINADKLDKEKVKEILR